VVLAGDIGGTKTILAIYSDRSGPGRPLATRTFRSAGYPDLGAMAKEFLAGSPRCCPRSRCAS
jgi:glucokinase